MIGLLSSPPPGEEILPLHTNGEPRQTCGEGMGRDSGLATEGPARLPTCPRVDAAVSGRNCSHRVSRLPIGVTSITSMEREAWNAAQSRRRLSQLGRTTGLSLL
jgi:hypothetical protein